MTRTGIEHFSIHRKEEHGRTLAAGNSERGEIVLGCLIVIAIIIILTFISAAQQQASVDRHMALPNPEIIEISPTTRTTVPIGEEERIIDNSHFDQPVLRTLEVKREWVQEYAVEYEKSAELKADSKLNLAVISGTAEESVRSKYGIKETDRQVVSKTENTSVTAPPRAKTRVIFRWKQVWQNGVIKMRVRKDEIATIPYRILTEVTFDQSQISDGTGT
jgi:hypothetical protein